jgi:lysophospholipase L1-like esterase
VYGEVQTVKIAFYGDSLTAGVPGASYMSLLRGWLPEDTLLHYGTINETAYSLYHRVMRQGWLTPVDVAFVWVGVNDVLVRRSPVFSRLRRQWARNPAAFATHYRLVLDALTPYTRRLVAVSPLLVGEDNHPGVGAALDETAAIIRESVAHCPNAIYLDVRVVLLAALRGKPTRAFRQTPLRSTLDWMLLTSPKQVDAAAARRGLHYTLDGVHLNSAGARLVAETFLNVIERERAETRAASV